MNHCSKTISALCALALSAGGASAQTPEPDADAPHMAESLVLDLDALELGDTLPFIDLSALSGGISTLPADALPETDDSFVLEAPPETSFGLGVDPEFEGSLSDLRAVREQVNPTPPKKSDQGRFKPEVGIRTGGREWRTDEEHRR